MFDHLKKVDMQPHKSQLIALPRDSQVVMEEVDVDVLSQKSESYRAKQSHHETFVKP